MVRGNHHRKYASSDGGLGGQAVQAVQTVSSNRASAGGAHSALRASYLSVNAVSHGGRLGVMYLLQADACGACHDRPGAAVRVGIGGWPCRFRHVHVRRRPCVTLPLSDPWLRIWCLTTIDATAIYVSYGLRWTRVCSV